MFRVLGNFAPDYRNICTQRVRVAAKNKPQMKGSAITDRLYVAQNIDQISVRVRQPFKCFRPQKALQYEPFCDDFGPVNISCVADFIKSLDWNFDSYPDSQIIFCVDEGKRNLTNAIFLLGAYIILKENVKSDEVAEWFESLDENRFEAFRDATFAKPDFGLSLLDCWKGLEKGKQIGWVRVSWTAEFCGKVNIRHYRHYDEPVHGDLHEVIPGKFIAFKGPVDLGGRDFRDSANGVRVFSPSFYSDIFRDMGVSTIIRLNEPRYDARDFTSEGFEHFDLEFEDCTCPPDEVVAAFFKIVDAAPGAVAVHCHAGLGRSGTLIALYLIRSHGFTARDAMGWLRIMRPGSVIGEQQHYLCEVERLLSEAKKNRNAGFLGSRPPSSSDSAAYAAQKHDSDLPEAPASYIARRPRLHRSRSDPGVENDAAAVPSVDGLRPPVSQRAAAAAGSARAPAAVLAEQVKAGMLRRSASFSGRLAC